MTVEALTFGFVLQGTPCEYRRSKSPLIACGATETPRDMPVTAAPGTVLDLHTDPLWHSG